MSQCASHVASQRTDVRDVGFGVTEAALRAEQSSPIRALVQAFRVKSTGFPRGPTGCSQLTDPLTEPNWNRAPFEISIRALTFILILVLVPRLHRGMRHRQQSQQSTIGLAHFSWFEPISPLDDGSDVWPFPIGLNPAHPLILPCR
jgi:hypothetical protein